MWDGTGFTFRRIRCCRFDDRGMGELDPLRFPISDSTDAGACSTK